jgi:hypothetical protein
MTVMPRRQRLNSCQFKIAAVSNRKANWREAEQSKKMNQVLLPSSKDSEVRYCFFVFMGMFAIFVFQKMLIQV